ncbi:50S ribosomal protein L10 [Candidatus Saccharibacteria bacterium CPR2]|nr:50S ribosomal protein L10 [Candidatus Saccharibacteria bacterium CPR2]
MAISKDKKQEIVSDLSDLFSSSKMTVFAQYKGVSVKELQELRKSAKEGSTFLRVSKNRLVKLALKDVDNLKDTEADILSGQLLYAFNAEDEVAPAQTLAQFAKNHPNLMLRGAIDSHGVVLDEQAVKQLADLPTKDQLRAQVVGTIAAPLSSFVQVLSGNLRGFITVLNARAEKIQ